MTQWVAEVQDPENGTRPSPSPDFLTHNPLYSDGVSILVISLGFPY